jgi:signal transduction histidine kinase/ligand-binding sensor domain-containing protein
MVTRIIAKSFSKLILIVICSINSPTFAQLNANNLTQYAEPDGLPSAEVHRILMDKFGYVWIGTINGLARFDGYEFKRFYFNPNDTLTIHGLDVESLYEDRGGQIWIGTSPTWLNAYNPVSKTFRQYAFAHLLKQPADVELNISAICQDNNGRIYFGVNPYRGEIITSALLFKEENEDTLKQFISPDSLPIQNVYSMTKDKSGNIWFLSYTGLFKIDTKGKLSSMHNSSAEEEGKKNNEGPTDIKFDKDGSMWITTSKDRLYQFDSNFSTYKVFTPPGSLYDFFSAMTFDKYENIWIGTNNGLIKFDKQTGKFEVFKNESKKQLEKAVMRDLQFDSFGTLWIATETQGLLKYEERAVFKSYSYNKDDKNSITPGWANTICETADGKIWIATSGIGSGINELDFHTNTIRTFLYKSILPGSWVAYGAFENNPGELLINTNKGNWQFPTKTNSAKKIELNCVPDSIAINQFYNDSKGNFWLCTLKGLFKKNKDAEAFRRYDLSTLPGANAVSNEITKAIESPKHGLWLTTNNGLFLYNYATDKIERHGFDEKEGNIFLTQDVNSLYEDADGMLWVGTWQGGLSMYNVETKKIKTYTQNDGLPSMSIQGILPDEKNNMLWLSTFDGLSRMDLKTKQFNNFSVADGIQGQLFADGAFLKTAGGFFVFGGSNGITIFNPDDINKRSTPPIVFLTDLKLFNKSVVPGEKSILKKPVYDTKEITLDYNQNNISLEFLAIHYSNPSKNKYSYKLENYDNEWRDIGNQHVAFYPNLPPGKYIFHVKAANNNGVWNEEGATLSITVNPPWWKTIWAYIIYGLLFIAVAFGLDRYFRHRLVQKERERNQARELAQAKEIEKAYNELKTTQAQLIQSEKMASLGELTAGIAHEIQNPLNFVNNFSEVNKELLVEMNGEIEKGNFIEAKSIAKDVTENEEKINHHGKRADAIVKGMLQHSRSSTGVKEPTDINALADEYFRLAYHGLRAKDKDFNATMNTDFDNSIGKINIIPQDIGRVLLNLYNNAFYAVNEKAKQQLNSLLTGHIGYEPIVSVGTKKVNDKVLLTVKDNGNGIPKKVLDKIFQPFFTTKPTGVGTGLGLSLSYDIIKTHGGEIKVETPPAGRAGKEGEGAEFTIQLPLI